MASILFISTIAHVPWGGSELLWHDASARLLERGRSVHVCTRFWNARPKQLEELERLGARLCTWGKRRGVISRKLEKLTLLGGTKLKSDYQRVVEACNAGFVLISSGSLRDDYSGLKFLSRSNVPYAVIIQASSPEIWPSSTQADVARKVLGSAARVYCVSRHNKRDVENSLGIGLDNARVVWNPIPHGGNVEPLPAPKRRDPLRIACVARLNILAKGQDLLIEMLSRSKWKDRPLIIRFYGEGPHRDSLERMAKLRGVGHKLEFMGHAGDIMDIWRDCHAGILPSRYEGMPLSLLEAMYLGRPCLVTNVCGNPEPITDGEDGWVAQAATVDALDAGMERLWESRNILAEMGAAAAVNIRKRIPQDPCASLADDIESLVGYS